MNLSMTIGVQLGSGTHSRVYSILQPGSSEEFCLKIVNEIALSDSSIRNRYEKCTNLLRHFDHTFLLRVYAVQRSEERKLFMIVTEKCEISLEDYVDRFNLSLYQVKNFASQVLLLIEYFRKKKVVFNGIHPSKIMIRKNGSLCMREPNFLTYKKRDISAVTTDINRYLRTFTYLSPELTQGVGEDHTSDLWSLGVLIFWMISKHVPYRCETPFLLFPKIRDQDIDWEIKEEKHSSSIVIWDEEAKDVITNLLKFEREERLGNMKKLMAHPFFKDNIRRIKRENRNKKNEMLQVIKDERERKKYLQFYVLENHHHQHQNTQAFGRLVLKKNNISFRTSKTILLIG